jgi:hypothetical protein
MMRSARTCAFPSVDDPSRTYRVVMPTYLPSVLRLRDVVTDRTVGKDDVELGLGHVDPALLNPFSVAFWNWLALKVAAKVLVKLVDPGALSASLDEKLQEDARGGVRCLSDGRYEVRVNSQGLDFIDLRHGLRLHVAPASKARRRPASESGSVA